MLPEWAVFFLWLARPAEAEKALCLLWWVFTFDDPIRVLLARLELVREHSEDTVVAHLRLTLRGNLEGVHKDWLYHPPLTLVVEELLSLHIAKLQFGLVILTSYLLESLSSSLLWWGWVAFLDEGLRLAGAHFFLDWICPLRNWMLLRKITLISIFGLSFKLAHVKRLKLRFP